jgi:hypothetical protein
MPSGKTLLAAGNAYVDRPASIVMRGCAWDDAEQGSQYHQAERLGELSLVICTLHYGLL